jgi:hypothetical protein
MSEGPTWQNRRRTLFTTLIFCAFVICYVMINGEDTRLNETLAQFAFITGASVVGSYIFGATWESIGLKK